MSVQDLAKETAAATAVGTDMLADHREKRRGFNRVLVAVALVGSAAAGDAEIEVEVADSRKGRVQNVRTGEVILDLADWKRLNVGIPAGEELRFRVSDAGATNILVAHFITQRV